MTDASRPWQPDRERLRQIWQASGEVVKVTPVFSFGALSRRCGGDIAIKAESLQRTGSFKLRGTTAKLRAMADDRPRGVVAGSAGNHGQALAYAARAHGMPCTVFMPAEAAVSKVEAVAAFDAEVRIGGATVDDCVAAAKDLAAADDLYFVHPFDDLEVIEGQAGVGLELLEQVPDLARVIVPVGGGGLIGGIAAALSTTRPRVEVIGVQASGCAAVRASLAAGKPVAVERASTIADGIAVKCPGELTLGLIERWVDELVEVGDDAIAAAMTLLVDRAKLVAEGAGAAAVAALASGAVTPAPRGVTVAILSGGNVDVGVLAAVLDRAQTRSGRHRRLFTRVRDRPGGLARLLETVAGAGANLIDVTHVRGGIALQVDETGVEMLVECRNSAAARTLVEELGDAGYKVTELDPPPEA
jgi:threonine dehydratase